MIIRSNDFDNGGEVDFLARYRHSVNARLGRLSARRASSGAYQLYIRFHDRLPPLEEVLCESISLDTIIRRSNMLCDLNDVVCQ